MIKKQINTRNVCVYLHMHVCSQNTCLGIVDKYKCISESLNIQSFYN